MRPIKPSSRIPSSLPVEVAALTRALLPEERNYLMPSPKLDDITFTTNSAAGSRRAFLDHLHRFETQSRDVSWREAPEAFARTYGAGGDDTTVNSFRSAMEELLDSGDIRVERLVDGGNRLVRVPAGRVREHRHMSYRWPKARRLCRRA